jgi:hypothetical protein
VAQSLLNRKFQIVAIAVCATLLSTTALLQAQSSALPPANSARVPVLLELFTSEGCSSCPPADELLFDLMKKQPVAGVDILGISEHVDYWNYLGWTDRFSSHVYSQRQEGYASGMRGSDVYTPQIVVDGASQVLGSDRSAVLSAVRKAANTPKLALSISNVKQTNGVVTASIALSTSGPATDLDLYAALTDDEDTTLVTGGENNGHSVRSAGVSRVVKGYGLVPASGQAAITIGPISPSTKQKTHLLVWCQSPSQGPVRAIASVALQ